MSVDIKQLSYEMIESSPEIMEWLEQFDESSRKTATSLLHHLKFITRDHYSNWALNKLDLLQNNNEKCALYSVRKLDTNEHIYCDINGNVIKRPGESQGSEDLVYSIVANAVRSKQGSFFDHPSLEILEKHKIHNIVLLDDSIGSGKRVASFIKAMFRNKTFLSWWSYGFIKFKVIAFARTIESEKFILSQLCGSNHGKRKYPKHSKLNFISELRYSKEWLLRRWGAQYQDIIDLCNSQTKIRGKLRLGYGDVMGNIVFYHSVPNNIPGVLFCKNNKLSPLLKDRTMPGWLIGLLSSDSRQKNNTSINNEARLLLRLIKKGIRSKSTLALRMDYDKAFINEIIDKSISMGFLTDKLHLTKTGSSLLRKKLPKAEYDRSIFIPDSWSIGQSTIQPSVRKEQTELTE